MKILLINPNFSIKKESRFDFSFFPPLGLGYLAALLESDGHKVAIQDLNLRYDSRGNVSVRDIGEGFIRYGSTEEETLEMIGQFNPDIVGVSSIFTPFFMDALRVTRLAKLAAPRALTVIGGAHASMEYKNVIQEPSVDFVIRGEAEIPFTKLIAKLAAKESFTEVPGVVWKENGEMRDQGMGEQVEDLDTLPFPAYHLLDMPFYTSRKDRNFAYSMRFPIGHMITSRGCPYTCVFCSTRNFFPNYRVNSAGRVIQEIEFLIKEYGVNEIHFHDDAYLIQRKRVEAISNLLIEKKLNIKWQISQGVNLNLVDEKLLEIMQKSGMYRMGLPIESGSPRTLELIRKRVKLDHAQKVIAAANRLGIFTHANFIIGFPFETEKELAETHSFAANSGVDFLKMLICQPLAGSELFETYKKEGLLDEIRHSSTYTSTDYSTANFTADELNRRRKEIIQSYQIARIKRILRPRSFVSSVLPKIQNPERMAYAVRIAFRMFFNRYFER